ncbi:MAG TPA: arylesterase [Gemmatimonadaceae bacterium]|nr:arylesterase [Gemmatimonadaceae bacterium]
MKRFTRFSATSMRLGLMFSGLWLAGCNAGESKKDIERAAGKTRDSVALSTATGALGSSDTLRAVRLLVIGTSLTAGLGLSPDEAYPSVLERMARIAGVPLRVINAGSSGETTAGALRRLDWVLRDSVDAIVVESGANDGLRAYDVEATRANLEAIVRRIQARQPWALVYLVQMEAPPNLGSDYTARFRSVFPEVASRTGAKLLPFLLEGVAGVAELNQADGIHPNAEGARRVAANLWTALRPDLEQLARRKSSRKAGAVEKAHSVR